MPAKRKTGFLPYNKYNAKFLDIINKKKLEMCLRDASIVKTFVTSSWDPHGARTDTAPQAVPDLCGELWSAHAQEHPALQLTHMN